MLTPRFLDDLTPPQATLAAVCATLFVLGGVWMPLDLDGDGASNVAELGDSDPFRNDSDGDGLPDGWESDLGLAPRDPDTDDDGIGDGIEVAMGADPLRVDSDGDGIPDGQELDQDCDGDGSRAILDPDDDGDSLLDGHPDEIPCTPDQDGDTVLDGLERATVCITAFDCDLDGLDDGTETQAGYDPLDPDTHGTGLSDSVVYAFQQRGSAPSGDDDQDGIPDAWENAEGAIEWGALQPSPGQRDLLVEFVRVEGPDSGRFDLDFDNAYEAVETMFLEEAGIRLQWRETTVRSTDEQRPSFLEPDTKDHFLDILGEARLSTNPYVTSVVLNPQQEQEEFGDILGAAFLRAMIAVVDYGAHTEVEFEEDSSDGLTLSGDTVTISPVVESHIVDADEDKINAFGYDDGGVAGSGDLFLFQESTNMDNPLRKAGLDITWTWTPDWFRVAPNITTDQGDWLQLRALGAQTDTAALASTIAHEMGHTLGLCHAHEASCYETFDLLDRLDRHASTMSYGSGLYALHFLDSEWDQVKAFLACPPEEPVRLVAEDADEMALLEAKYGQAFEEEVNARACGDHTPVQEDLQPTTATPYLAPTEARDPPMARSMVWPGTLYVMVSLGAAAGAGAFVWRRWTTIK